MKYQKQGVANVSDIQLRHTVESLYALKCETLTEAHTLWAKEKSLSNIYESINGHSPYRVENYNKIYGENQDMKCIDQALWRYLVRLYSLEKFMLCTDHQKMVDQIDKFQTPEFTIENASGWLDGLKNLIRDNVHALVKKVYSEITNGFYYTGGSGYRGDKKKRNNNGIDKNFILYTADWSTIFAYWRYSPSIMDDLEKVCYILDGKTLPEKTIRQELKAGQKADASNQYMSVKLCQNGNTHFTLDETIRALLNKYGPTGTEIGENIKIKVFER